MSSFTAEDAAASQVTLDAVEGLLQPGAAAAAELRAARAALAEADEELAAATAKQAKAQQRVTAAFSASNQALADAVVFMRETFPET